MRGAAAVMASPELEVDAMALEMVYPDINSATANRMEKISGRLGARSGAVIDYAITLARGDKLSRCARHSTMSVRLKLPNFSIAGAKDRHTKLTELRELFEAGEASRKRFVGG